MSSFTGWDQFKLFADLVNGEPISAFQPDEQHAIMDFLGMPKPNEIMAAIRKKLVQLAGSAYDPLQGRGLGAAQIFATEKDKANNTSIPWAPGTGPGTPSAADVQAAAEAAAKAAAAAAKRQAMIEGYKAVAEQAGLNINGEKIGWLLHNNVSLTEFQHRAAAITRLETNKDLYRQFGAALVQEGVAKPGSVSKAELFKFVLGEGNREWYNVWNLAAARNAATQAGVALGKKAQDDYESLSGSLVKKVSRKGLSESQLTSGFKAVAQNLLTTVPLSRIQNYGLSKADITVAVFGGPHQAEIQAKIKQILATEKAFSEGGASGPIAGLKETAQG